MRPFNKRLRRSSSAAGGRLRLGALLLAAVLVGSAASAEAAETYRGSDPDSYECSSDYNILNRFSAPPGVSAARSTKYSDIKFTLENNVISVKDASNSRGLAYISVGENTKYCAYKDVEIIKERTEPKFKDPRFYPQNCNINYHAFHTRIVIDAGLPVRTFSLHGPPEFDRMDHLVDVDVYRAADHRKSVFAAGCNEVGDSPDSHFFAIGNHGLRTTNKSVLNVIEESPFGFASSAYEREALKKAGTVILRQK
ncbi:hypothetical protein [Methylocystis sp. SB2]|uniref:hypothetical protein n=1 Tax=Methylocystis sp. (strain SB2) TaxID=743836 RepID=UPI0004A26F20|nr:hypothetical protein [Methylocystis sp. SB2]ULO24681.1 hypothetical protein LNB28_04600 [Methylocystis sp. SB2]